MCPEDDHDRVKITYEDMCPEDQHDSVKMSCEDVFPEVSHDTVKLSTSLVVTSHPHAAPTPIHHPSSYSLSACLSPLTPICLIATSSTQAFPHSCLPHE